MRGALVQGWLAVALLVMGAAVGVTTLARSNWELAAAATAGAVLDGRAAAAVNRLMAHGLAGGSALSAAGAVWRWGVFGSGGPQVVVGCDGWLFLTEELRPWADADSAMAARAAAMRRVSAGLAARGIELAVVLAPDKARMAPQAGCGVRYSAQARGRYDAFGARLSGVSWVDLTEAFRGAPGPLYYRTDTHWNQAGAALAAAAVAAAVEAPIGRERPFRTEYGPEGARPGDLLRLMGLADVPDALRPRADRERPATTAGVAAQEDLVGLLDEPDVPEVVLLGSSYSLNGNFHGALQVALAAPVAQFAQAGGGFWRSARDYFRSPAFRETPPKLVVWEMPERVVGQPVEPEEAAFMLDWEGR